MINQVYSFCTVTLDLVWLLIRWILCGFYTIQYIETMLYFSFVFNLFDLVIHVSYHVSYYCFCPSQIPCEHAFCLTCARSGCSCFL